MSHQLHICQVMTTWYDKAATPRRTLELIRGLKSRNYHIDLMVGQEASEPFIERVKKEGIRVIRIPSLLKYISPPNDLQALKVMKNHFVTKRYDIVHTCLPKAGILGRYAARKAKVPSIVHTVVGPSSINYRNPWLRKIFINLEQRAAKYTDAIVYVGQELRDLYLTTGIGNQENSHVIYTGRNFEQFSKAIALNEEERMEIRQSLGFQKEDIIVGYVARIVPSKGHVYAIQAAQKLVKKFHRLHFLFIGEANVPSEKAHKDFIVSEIKKRHLQNHIVLLDYQKNIASYYAIFNAYILPSLYEGLPNSVIEAAVMGLPVVAFSCSGVREILGNQNHIVPVGDTNQLINKLEDTIYSLISKKYKPISETFKQALLKKWDIKSMIDSMDQLYKSLS